MEQLTINVANMTTNTVNFQQRTKTTFYTIKNHIVQMTTSINQLQSQGSNKLPQNVSVITLRSGKTIHVLDEQHFWQAKESIHQ